MFYMIPGNTFNIKQIENEVKNIGFRNSDFATIDDNSKQFQISNILRLFSQYTRDSVILKI